MTVRQSVCFGDSLTQGTEGHFDIAYGGKGNWPELVTERLANLPDVGPVISSGIRGHWLFLTGASSMSGEVTSAGTWTTVTGADVFDKCPKSRYGNGSDRILTFTKPSSLRTAVGFALYYVDMAGGGDFQYRVNGGAYALTSQTFTGGNAVKKFYVSSAGATVVDVRCYNGTTGVNTLPVGIEWFWLAPSTTTGIINHNLGCDGQLLKELLTSAAGDKLAVVDTVTLGTGSPISNTPNFYSLIMYIRDVTNHSTSQWNTDLTTIEARMDDYSTVVFQNPHEFKDGVDFPTAEQATYRAQTITTAASVGATMGVDLYAQLTAKGISGYTAEKTYGLVSSDVSDNGHFIQAGMFDVAERVYWQIRNTILGVGNVPSTYTAKAKLADVAYGGKLASVAYAGATPVGVG